MRPVRLAARSQTLVFDWLEQTAGGPFASESNTVYGSTIPLPNYFGDPDFRRMCNDYTRVKLARVTYTFIPMDKRVTPVADISLAEDYNTTLAAPLYKTAEWYYWVRPQDMHYWPPKIGPAVTVGEVSYAADDPTNPNNIQLRNILRKTPGVMHFRDFSPGRFSYRPRVISYTPTSAFSSGGVQSFPGTTFLALSTNPRSRPYPWYRTDAMMGTMSQEFTQFTSWTQGALPPAEDLPYAYVGKATYPLTVPLKAIYYGWPEAPQCRYAVHIRMVFKFKGRVAFGNFGMLPTTPQYKSFFSVAPKQPAYGVFNVPEVPGGPVNSPDWAPINPD